MQNVKEGDNITPQKTLISSKVSSVDALFAIALEAYYGKEYLVIVSDSLRELLYRHVIEQNKSNRESGRFNTIVTAATCTIRGVADLASRTLISIDVYPTNGEKPKRGINLFYSKDIEEGKFEVFDRDLYAE